MLRGCRCATLVFVGCLTIAASPPNQGGNNHHRRAASRTEQALDRIAATLQEANKPEQPDHGCYPGKENRRSDLCAQWKAADAAQASADWTRRTFWLGVFGFAVGTFTLIAAGFAAWYAREASISSANTLAHEKEVSGFQLSPVLHVESVDVAEPKNYRKTRVTIEIQNASDVPAKNFLVTGAWGFRIDIDTRPLVLQPCIAPKGLSQGKVKHVALPPSEGGQPAARAILYCEFVITWENKSGEERRIAEIHKFDGQDFRLWRDT